PRNDDLLLLLSNLYRLNDHDKKLDSLLVQWRENLPESSNLQAALAARTSRMALQEQNESGREALFRQALAHLDRGVQDATDIDGSNIWRHLFQATVSNRLEHPQTAVRFDAIKAFYADQPQSIDRAFVLAVVAASRGDHDAALGHLQECRKLEHWCFRWIWDSYFDNEFYPELNSHTGIANILREMDEHNAAVLDRAREELPALFDVASWGEPASL
ncbi:MAG: hypothetical protein AAF525_05500, partial [Pseudomonadota bacterium]